MNIIRLISFYFKADFIYKHKDDLDNIKKNLYLHIDKLEQLGWNKGQLFIKTNFDFAYNGIKNHPFIYNDCQNLFLTKIIAAHEVLCDYPNHILWQHDHDTYQIRPFDHELLASELVSDINLCKYWSDNNKPQGASIFYKGFSKTIEDLYQYIQMPNQDFLNKKYSDEEVFSHFQQLNFSINTNLSFGYNTSLTKYSANKRKTEYPFCVHGDLRRKFDTKLFKYYENLTKYND